MLSTLLRQSTEAPAIKEPAIAIAPGIEPKFFPPNPDFPQWPGNIALTGTDFVLLNQGKQSHSNINIKSTDPDPLKDKATPIVFLTPKVLKEIQYIVEKMAKKTGECAWMFLGRPLSKNGPHVLLYDYFLAAQDATMAHVTLDLEDVARYTEYLKETYPDEWPNGGVVENLHHGHSHGNLGVFESGTDKNQQEDPAELGFQSDRRFFLVFNNKKEVHASMILYRPVYVRFENIPVGIYTGEDMPNPPLTAARKAEIDEQLEALVKKPAPVISNFGNWHSSHRYYNQPNNYVHPWDYEAPRDYAASPSKRAMPTSLYAEPNNQSDMPEDYAGQATMTIGEMCQDLFAVTLQIEDLSPEHLGEVKRFLNSATHSAEYVAAIKALQEVGLFEEFPETEFIEDYVLATIANWWDSAFTSDLPPNLEELMTYSLSRLHEVIQDLVTLMGTVFWDEPLSIMEPELLFNHLDKGLASVLFNYDEAGLL
jgi:hypothetical protein